MPHLRSATAIHLALLVSGTSVDAQAAPDLATPIEADLSGPMIPTGMRITPEAMPGSELSTLNPNLPGLPDFTAGQAAAVTISPDGRTMLVPTSGFNRNYDPNGDVIPELSSE